MDDTDIFVKTSAGSDELRARSRKLTPRLRTMLIMVDGMLTVTQLQRAAATLGAPNDFLDVLVAQGLVEARLRSAAASAAAEASVAAPGSATGDDVAVPLLLPATDAERFRAAQKFMNDSVVDALGLRAFFFTLKMERCFTLADLRALLPEFGKAVTKGSGEDAARVLGARVRELIG